MKKTIPFIALCLFLISSCEIINPGEDLPVYLKIDSVNVMTTTEEGTNSNNISDVWVSVDGELLGTFPLPARIPVLESGSKRVDIFAGIKVNGIAATSDLYPFYERYETTIDFVPGEEVELTPTFIYTTDAVFQILENFENLNHLLSNDLDGNSLTSLMLNAEGFEGVGGLATLSTGNEVMQTGSDLITEFPNNSFVTYVEVNYKTEARFAIGLVGYSINGSEIYSDFSLQSPTFRGVNESSVWKKIYLNFSDSMQALMSTPNIAAYRIVLITQIDGVQTSAQVRIDNFKLIHF